MRLKVGAGTHTGRVRELNEDAYMLGSLAASLRVTQAVDATKGIHAMLAKSIFTAQ